VNVELPTQGWKLHVSATVAAAEEILRRALPVLIEGGATFKVAGSPAMLAELNEGSLGLSQIGKFLTVYPVDDANAVELAVALDVVTSGLPAPVVPSDRPLRRGSIVSYRYGGFSTPFVQTMIGEVLPSLVTADGRLSADRRGLWYLPPEDREDPFEQFQRDDPGQQATLFVSDRYALSTMVQWSPRGAVYLALDTREAQRVVVKMARRGSLGCELGRDACDRLRAEAAVIAALTPHSAIPAVYDLVEQDNGAGLVMEDIEGETFEAHVHALAIRGHFVSQAQAVDWGRQLVSVLGHIHLCGYVYRDLKSPNVIIGPEGRLRLVDFDMAQPIGDSTRPFGKGTRGYLSPQQKSGEPPHPTDDIYGVGAVLYFLLTGAEPSRAPSEFELLSRPIQQLNPAVGADLIAIIEKCLALMPSQRYATMQELDDALVSANRDPVRHDRLPLLDEPEARAAARASALRLARTICAEARPAPFGEGLAWSTCHPLGSGRLRTRDINIGSAGTLLALAELASEYREPGLLEASERAAQWLMVAPPFAGEPLAGLYVGEAGIGAALLRAGQLLDDPHLVKAAADRGRQISVMPHSSPDLFNGTAGRLRFHLWLWEQTHEQEHLVAAIEAGGVLVQQAQSNDDGHVRWIMPSGYGSMSGTALLGYAHGAAGIADTLLDLFLVTGDAAAGAAAEGAARWLTSLAQPALHDGRGRIWPASEGDDVVQPWWCHGSTGIGRFLLRIATAGLVPAAEDVALGAAQMVARSRYLAPSQCHGLAGSIEFLLDVYRASEDRGWLGDARLLASLLDAYASESEGNLVYAAENADVFTPDYMVGYAGIAVTLLRLADPKIRPVQLSLEGFRYRP
jgi:hypothetical protein